jgi:hypothetical protein
MVHVLAATPAYDGKVVLEYLTSFLAMQKEAWDTGVEMGKMTTHSGFVSRSRNTSVAQFLKHKQFTHFLTIDADMGWPKGTLTRFLDYDKDVVGGVYPSRVFSEVPSFVVGAVRGDEVTSHGFMKVYHVGCGFMLVKRAVIERMVEAYGERKYIDETLPDVPHWDLFPSGFFPPIGKEITDDVGFCYLARKIGVTIWADVRTPMTHTGHATFQLHKPMEGYMNSSDFPVVGGLFKYPPEHA